MSFLLKLLTLSSLPLSAFAGESAWNGHLNPDSTALSAFTPYYVPPGAKSYDSASPLVHYSGKWTDSYSQRYIGHTLRSTTSKGAAITFTFTGTGVEWFGNADARHGIADVYIDGKLTDRVDAYSVTAYRQQRVFWAFGLPYGKHTIKIAHSGRKSADARAQIVDIDAFVVTIGTAPRQSALLRPSPAAQNSAAQGGAVQNNEAAAPAAGAQWTLTKQGTTGVHAMQLAIISNTHALIMDKVEHNPLTIDGHPAWGALYDLNTHAVTPLRVQSNSFCAGGTFLSNGTLVNVGGNPVVEDRTASADFGDVDGMQAVRVFEPCDAPDAGGCVLYENHAQIRLASPRWYNTVLRIADGSAMVLGGSRKGGWMNNATTNNPTLEYFPPKNIHGHNGLPVPSPFLSDTLNANLFPLAFALPDGRIFVAANNAAMLYDWRADAETRLPALPNGVRVTYPMSGTALLLPLDPATDYAPEVLICGGSALDDKTPSWQISTQDPASAQCARMLLTDAGIAAGWQVEQMPGPRIMPDAVLLPTGDVVLVNGGATGIAGYGNVKDQVGASNAANPVLAPVLYRPGATAGARFDAAGMPTSNIPRLYHSVATLTPRGDVMIAGSNPNLDRSEVEYGTEYRVEWLAPPYMVMERPALSGVPRLLGFGQALELDIKLPDGVQASEVKGTRVVAIQAGNSTLTGWVVSLMDLGYVTHAVHANSRLVYLQATLSDDRTKITIIGPPSGEVYPPGPGWLYVVASGVPSVGQKILVGDGNGPPVDQDAIGKCVVNLCF
jgi:hypothetical protein